jgi:AraC-like DNA-binding protein
MHFDLSGQTLTHVNGYNSSNFSFDTMQHNIIYSPGIKGRVQFDTPAIQMMEINISPTLFKKYIAGNSAFEDFTAEIDRQNPAVLGKHHLSVTSSMLMVIESIINCQRIGTFKRLFLESKVTELLLLQLEQFTIHACNDFCTLKPLDMEKMHHAREIIHSRTYDSHSLRKIALEVGTNEFTLKKGFKEVFGTTVFTMLTDLKMEQAKQLLMEGNKSINEISLVSGYKNSAHFSTAFKRKFGITPGKLRNVR